jgi:hypothetical protein
VAFCSAPPRGGGPQCLRQNFAGTFTSGGGLAPELDAGNQPIPGAGGQLLEVAISSIERYQRTL